MTGSDWVNIIVVLGFFGWIPILALGAGIAMIIEAWRK